MRYRALSGLSDDPQTTAELKEYLDVAVYRNILDLLKQYNGSLKAVGNWARNKLIPMHRGREKIARAGGGLWGYMKKEGMDTNCPICYTDKYLEKANLPPLAYRDVRVPQTSPYDLLSLSRSIALEMNRIRLPMPANFRKYSALVEGRIYDDIKIGKDGIFDQVYSNHSVISLWELLIALPKLKKEAESMIREVRKEIDAANLAAQVQEETIEKERTDLQTRTQAEQEAARAALVIQKEKEKAYEADYEKIIQRKEQLIDARTQLNIDLAAMSAVLPTITDTAVLQQTQNRINSLNVKLQQLEAEERNIDVLSETLIKAVQNLASDNTELRAHIAQLDITRNREKSQTIRDLEKAIEEYRLNAQLKIDTLAKQRQAELDKLDVLKNTGAPAPEVEAVKTQITNIEADMETIVNTVNADAQASSNATAQKTALQNDNQYTASILSTQQAIDALVKKQLDGLGSDADAAQIAELQKQLQSLTTQKALNQQNIDILKSQAQTLENTVVPKKSGSILPLLGLLTLVLSQ